MAEDKEKVIDELRTQVLQESLHQPEKSRFGLFSVPPAGVSSFTTEIVSKKKRLGPDGKPLTMPRGIFIGSPRSGKMESSFFSKVGYTSIGDPYIDPMKQKRMGEIAKKKLNKHESEWKSPVQVYTDPATPVYKYMSNYIKNEKSHRDANGKVITENRNIFTTCPHPGYGSSTIGHLFSKPDKYMEDPYDRKKELAKKQNEEGKKKLQEQSFVSVAHGDGVFFDDKKTYGLDISLPEKNIKPKEKLLKIHDSPFKPSGSIKKGQDADFCKFPEYKSDPIRQVERKIEDPSQKKDSFKVGNLSISVRPTPSISVLKTNLRRELSQISPKFI